MAQGMLFNIPSRVASKADNKGLINKTKNKAVQKVVTVNSANRITAIIETARKMLVEDERLQCIFDEKEFEAYIENCVENGIAALDTETTGLNPILDEVVGVCLYTPHGKAIYAPMKHRSYMTGEVKEGQLSVEAVKKGLQRLVDAGVKLLFHNAKFDIRMIWWNLGVRIEPSWDTMIAGCCLNENEPHGLKYLHEKYIMRSKGGSTLKTYETLFEDVDFSHVPYDIGYLYAAKDALMTYELYKFQEKHLNSEKLADINYLYREIELPLISVVADMENEGVMIDTEFAEQLSVKYNDLLEKAKDKVFKEMRYFEDDIKKFKKKEPEKYAKLDNPINLSSPQQLAILFYDVLGLESPDPKKPRGTGADILEEFGLPIGKAIIEYKTIEKLLTTYIEKLPNVINPKTGRVHGKFNQYGAVTGRFSSSDPNLQNIPSHNKEIRQMFIVPEGYVMLGADYSQQEPRCLAHLSNDEFLLEAYRTGKDIYSTFASKVYKVPYEDCLEFYLDKDGKKTDKVNKEGKERRQRTKSIVLGIMYGRGAKSIADQTGMTEDEAQGIIDDFFVAFPKIKKFVEDSEENARKYGYVQTIWGRKRRLPEMMLPQFEFEDSYGKELPQNIIGNYMRMLNNAGFKQRKRIIGDARKIGVYIKDNGWIISKASRQVVNSIIQGSSADITKKAMILLARHERLRELGYKMMLTVHDEIIGLAPKETANECMEIVKELMLKAPSDRIDLPFKCDPELTLKWYGEQIAV